MEIYLDRRAIRQIRVSVQEAIEEGDTEACREEILEAFSEEQIEEIERRLDHGDMFEFVTDLLDEWSGEDVDELLELLETQLGEVGLDLKVDEKDEEVDEEEDDEEEEFEAEAEADDEDTPTPGAGDEEEEPEADFDE
jgi:hypothetical protein